MGRQLKVTEQKFNTIKRHLERNNDRDSLERLAASHGLKLGTIITIRGAKSYEKYRNRTLTGHTAEKQLDKITQANPIKRLDEVAPVSTALEQIAKLRARVENLEDLERRRSNEEFHLEAAQDSRGWFHWLRRDG